MNVVGLFLGQATARPGAQALGTPGGAVSYGQLLGRVARIAAGLAAAGMREGEVVALECEAVDFIAATLGIAWAGGVSVNMPPGGHRAAARIGVTRFVTDGAAPHLPPAPTHRLEDLERAGEVPIAVVQRRPDALWRIVLSSGTTGEPKAIEFTHASCLAKNRGVCELPPALLGDGTLLQVGYATGFGSTYWFRELSRGTRVEVVTEAAAALKSLSKGGVDLLVASPGNAIALAAALAGTSGAKGNAARAMLLAGAALNAKQRESLRAQVCSNLWVCYGSTEIGLIALQSPRLMETDPDCAGRLLPGVEAHAVDDAGRKLPAGEEGRLRMRSPAMARGYVIQDSSPAEEREAFRDGWFQSRDVGRVDRERRVYLRARQDEVLNLDGNKVAPAMIEGLIEQLPGIEECAVVHATLQDGQSLLVAFVVAAGAVDAEVVLARCRAGLPKWQVPARIVQLAALPRNDAGKVLRRELVERAGAGA